jgi:hypothetical protein
MRALHTTTASATSAVASRRADARKHRCAPGNRVPCSHLAEIANLQ